MYSEQSKFSKKNRHKKEHKYSQGSYYKNNSNKKHFRPDYYGFSNTMSNSNRPRFQSDESSNYDDGLRYSEVLNTPQHSISMHGIQNQPFKIDDKITAFSTGKKNHKFRSVVNNSTNLKPHRLNLSQVSVWNSNSSDR